jgi:hypothetical protein
MSSLGHCSDDVLPGPFFPTLEIEFTDRTHRSTRDLAQVALAAHNDSFYNPEPPELPPSTLLQNE